MKSEYLAKALLKLSKEGSSQKAVDAFVKFVKKKNLLELLPRVMRYIAIEQEKEKQSILFTLSVARPVSKEIKSAIKKVSPIDKKAPELVSVNPELVGGFVAEYQDVIYDASIKGQLQRLKKALA